MTEQKKLGLSAEEYPKVYRWWALVEVRPAVSCSIVSSWWWWWWDVYIQMRRRGLRAIDRMRFFWKGKKINFASRSSRLFPDNSLLLVVVVVTSIYSHKEGGASKSLRTEYRILDKIKYGFVEDICCVCKNSPVAAPTSLRARWSAGRMTLMTHPSSLLRCSDALLWWGKRERGTREWGSPTTWCSAGRVTLIRHPSSHMRWSAGWVTVSRHPSSPSRCTEAFLKVKFWWSTRECST